MGEGALGLIKREWDLCLQTEECGESLLLLGVRCGAPGLALNVVGENRILTVGPHPK